MSRDIFVQDLPRDARTVAEIPHDFRPQPIGYSSEHIIETIKRLAPSADFSNPSWGVVDGPAYSIEVSLSEGDNLHSFALHVRGAGADPFIDALLRTLDLRALDSDSAEGIILPQASASN